MNTIRRTNNRSIHRRLLAAGLIVAGLLASVVNVSPAHAATATQPQVDKAVAVSKAATFQLSITWTATVKDDQNYVINKGKPVQAGVGCSSFAVTADGYIVTAGHCVDPSNAVAKVLSAAVASEVAAGNWKTNGRAATADDLAKYAAAHWHVVGSSGPTPDLDVQVLLPKDNTNAGEKVTARVLEFKGFDDGDTALLKVATHALPTLELATDDQVHEGADVVSIGFADDTDNTDWGSASFKDGRVSSKRTKGNGKLPIYEISAGLSHGMSGGPTVDDQGRVIGVNSFKSDSDSFNFIMRSSLVAEMLGRNNVHVALSDTDQAFRTAVDHYNAGNFRAAASLLRDVVEKQPQFAAAKELQLDADALAAKTPEGSGLPITGLAIASLVLVAGALLVRHRKTERPAYNAPSTGPVWTTF